VAAERTRSPTVDKMNGKAATRRASGPPEHVPITGDGLPDLAAMRALGMGKAGDEWSRRMDLVARFRSARNAAAHGQTGAAAERIAAECGVPVKTLYRWDRALDSGGPVALVPARGGARRGTTMLPPKLCDKIRAYWMSRQLPPVTEVFDRVVVPYYANNGRACPHLATVRRYLASAVSPIEAVAFREGPRAFAANCAPKVRRALPERVNEVWVADHRLWDILVVVPDGKGVGWGGTKAKPCPCGSGEKRRDCCSLRRPWVTMIADVRSAAWVGWRIGLGSV